MKKIVNTPLLVSLLILTVLGCAGVKEQETEILPQEEKAAATDKGTIPEKKEDKALKQTPANSITLKTTLIFNVSSCSWSYVDDNGKLHAVSVTDGKPRYIKSGEAYYIDLKKTEIVFE